ncbi:MAG: dTDP-4-dehydrorhamnose reductase [Rhodobacteraceae bacterium]|nr:dTDP-4-dehydrorhamnose reductase [Paracoccaceae bacterium]
MKVLVFGRTGQVAHALAQHDGVMVLDRAQADLMQPDICADWIARTDADAVINAAAFTAVDGAQSDADTAMMVNGTTPGAMAVAAAVRDLPFVHISTDYVFDGSGVQPWQPDAAKGPLNVYGASKLAGEQAIQAAGGRFVILRTSWVFSPEGNNFVKTMLRLSHTRDVLNIVEDQVGGPTGADDIANACLEIARQLAINPVLAGTYHFSGAPDVSWADFARVIFHKAGKDVQVSGIATSEYSTPAKRPLNSRLDCSALSAFGLHRPDWGLALTRVLHQLEGTP